MQKIKVSPKNFKKAISKIERFLKEGKIIVCPTDTVYGLVSDAANKKAVERLFKIKQRPQNRPLPIFVKNIKAAKKLAQISKRQEEFLKKLWPGKATFVLKRKGKEKIYGVEEETIALRIPDYKLINLLLEKSNLFLTGTSANISGEPASTKIKEIIKQFQNQKHLPDLVIDAGNLSKSKPSTVLDLTKLPPKTLRD